MHKDFAEWYSVVSLSPSQPLLEVRDRAITRIVETATPENILDVARIYLGARSKNIAYSQNMRMIFVEQDETFQAKENDAELQVLSGAVIVELVTKRPSHLADIVALALSSARNAREQHGPLVPHLIAYTEHYLIEESHRVRVPSPATRIGKPADGTTSALKNIEEYEQSVTAGTLTPQMATELSSSLKQLQSLNKSYSKLVSDAEKSIVGNNAILQEENEILWWMLGGRCRRDLQPFAALPIPLAAFLVGGELAELTQFLPEHPYAMAIINEVLCRMRSNQNMLVSVQDMVGAIPETYTTSWTTATNHDQSLDFCPVHAAVVDSLANHNRNWHPVWAHKAISLSEPRPAVEMAYQVYIECLFRKSLA